MPLMTTYQTPVNVFLSYAHEDEALLKELVKHLSLLKRQGLIATWYDRQIVPGTNWAMAIDEQVEQASIILLLVSPGFLASDYCYQIEMKHALEQHDTGESRVIPLLVRPADWKDAPFAHLQALPTNMKPITTWSNQDEAFVDIVAGIRRAIEDLPLLTASASRAALPTIWTIPYPPNSFFLEHDDLFLQLHIKLRSGQAIALSGLGGVGKTQIAVEYAYYYHHEYEAVFWVHAESEEALISSYTRIAMLLKLPSQRAKEQNNILEEVKEWLQMHQRWLLILDNADELDLLPLFLPKVTRGHILFTTRAWDMQRLATRLEVDALSNEQGALLLLRRSGLIAPDSELLRASLEDRRLAGQITQELGGLPLALDQIGAYLEATGTSLGEYQQIYQKYRQLLLQERRSRVRDHPDSVATTWAPSFKRIEDKNPGAAELLRFCAYLAPDDIPEEMLTQGASHLGSLLGDVVTNPFRFAQAIEILRAYSLISRNPQTQTLSIHRLVQTIIRDNLSAQAKQQWKGRLLSVLMEASQYAKGDAYKRWFPHALAYMFLIEQEHITSLGAISTFELELKYLLQEFALLRKLIVSLTFLLPTKPQDVTLEKYENLYKKLYENTLVCLMIYHPECVLDNSKGFVTIVNKIAFKKLHKRRDFAVTFARFAIPSLAALEKLAAKIDACILVLNSYNS